MKLLTSALLVLSFSCFSQTKILFDGSKAQMCSNADWVIDADTYNIGIGTGGSMQTGQSNEANPQRFPSPAQSGITQLTTETFWDGALSAWAVDLVKLGYAVETLPYNGSITYGNSGNSQDLSHYKVFICDEPNILFTASEKTALLQFVQNGGGLFMIADHAVSDRNFDGFDSPQIWNDLMDNNSIQLHPFGIAFDSTDYSQTSSNLAVLPNDSCLHNAAIGNVSQIKISGGCTITLNQTQNSSAKGLIFKNGAANTGTTLAFLATARFGTGRVAALTDSSPPDDGTGDANDNLFFSYTGEVNGSHRIMLLNTTIWLATSSLVSEIENTNREFSLEVFPNPVHGEDLHINANNDLLGQPATLLNTEGEIVWSETLHSTETLIPLSNVAPGIYFLQTAGITKKVLHLF